MKKYWLASRPYSYTASLVPVLLGTALAKLLFPTLAIHWPHFVLVLFGCVAVQAISNLTNDLVDSKTGLDSKETVGRFNALTAGTLTWNQMFKAVLVLCAVCLVIGGYFTWLVGSPILWTVAVGAVLAIEYTAPPLKLKYVAMGDLAVLVAFGLGMVYGAYFVQTYTLGREVYLAPHNLVEILIYTIPSSLLVVAILHANNHRDRENDKKHGANTMANVLGFRTSKSVLLSMLIGPYVFALVAVIAGWVTPFTLLVALSVPPLIKLLKPVFQDRYERTVPQVAKLHGQFGLLMTLAIVAQIVIHPAAK